MILPALRHIVVLKQTYLALVDVIHTALQAHRVDDELLGCLGYVLFQFVLYRLHLDRIAENRACHAGKECASAVGNYKDLIQVTDEIFSAFSYSSKRIDDIGDLTENIGFRNQTVIRNKGEIPFFGKPGCQVPVLFFSASNQAAAMDIDDNRMLFGIVIRAINVHEKILLAANTNLSGSYAFMRHSRLRLDDFFYMGAFFLGGGIDEIHDKNFLSN